MTLKDLPALERLVLWGAEIDRLTLLNLPRLESAIFNRSEVGEFSTERTPELESFRMVNSRRPALFKQ